VLPQPSRCDIAFGTHDGVQRGTVFGLHQLRDLPANALERQTTEGGEAFDLGGTCQDHYRRAG